MTKSASVDISQLKNLHDCYKIKVSKKVNYPPKIWGIDSMSTILAAAIVRLYYESE